MSVCSDGVLQGDQGGFGGGLPCVALAPRTFDGDPDAQNGRSGLESGLARIEDARSRCEQGGPRIEDTRSRCEKGRTGIEDTHSRSAASAGG